MNMLDGLSGLGDNALGKVLRRTVVSALVVGVAAVLIALLLSAPWAALGIGAVVGLVIFQLLFVVNVGRVIVSQGIQ